MSDIKVTKIGSYIKAVKKLVKKYRNIEEDVQGFLQSIASKDDLGVELKNNIYKTRVNNSNKNKGKRAGYRLISYLKLVENELILVYIYDKSDLDNIKEEDIDRLILEMLSE